MDFTVEELAAVDAGREVSPHCSPQEAAASAVAESASLGMHSAPNLSSSSSSAAGPLLPAMQSASGAPLGLAVQTTGGVPVPGSAVKAKKPFVVWNKHWTLEVLQ